MCLYNGRKNKDYNSSRKTTGKPLFLTVVYSFIMEQYRIVELFNANSEIYWNINKFVESQGFSNVVEYCAEILSKVGSVDWCTATVKEDMYNQSNRDLEFIYEEQ